MPEITKITINNIKGFGEVDNSIDVDIKPGKINYLIAPNGFGKSTIAVAFESLNANRLVLEKDNYHMQDDTKEASVIVTYDGNEYVADRNQNQLAGIFDVTVINGGLIANSKAVGYVGGVRHVGELEVESIVLRTSVPSKEVLDYKITDVRGSFGPNKKLLENYCEQFDQHGFASKIISCYPELSEIYKRDGKKEIDRLVSRLNGMRGTAEQIRNSVSDAEFEALESNPLYQSIQDKLAQYRICNNRIGRFLFFYQVLWLSINKRANLYKRKTYEAYEELKKHYDAIVHSIDTTGRQLTLKEEGQRLLLEFPPASTISNGQRDVITFILRLEHFSVTHNRNNKQLLIIDEIFDYLDDANIVAAQSYLSRLLKAEGQNIYIVLLSHNSPRPLNAWVLKKKINVQYIYTGKAKAEPNSKSFIAFRERIRKVDIQGYKDLSSYYFHYHPEVENVDLSRLYVANEGLKSSWFKGTNLHKDIIVEVNKYLAGAEEYDPYSVCMAMRIMCEKHIYERLDSDADRNTFITAEDLRTTTQKLEWALDKEVEVNSMYSLLAVIFNEADHLSWTEWKNNQERYCVYRLDNPAIRQMARMLFGYGGDDLPYTILV